MRVLLFSSTYRPDIGGVETVTDRLARELKSRGHDVSVVTNRYPASLAASEVISGIPVTRRRFPNLVPSPGRRPLATLLKQVASIPLGAYELARLTRRLRRDRPDVVNVHYLAYPAMYALLAAKASRLPVVLSFHGSDVAGSPYPATYRWVQRLACRWADRIVCNSEDLANYLRMDMRPSDGAKVAICPFGIDDWAADGSTNVHSARRDDAGGGQFALVAARLVEKKGVDVAINAMAAYPGPLNLKIAGDGPLRSELQELAEKVCVSSRVHFVGELQPDDLRSLMLRSAFVVVPSYWEAFGVVALEAMVAGKAVIAAANGGIAEIVVDGETGLLVASGDAAALSDAMDRLASDPALAASMGVKGRVRAVESYVWKAIGESYEKLLTSAVAS